MNRAQKTFWKMLLALVLIVLTVSIIGRALGLSGFLVDVLVALGAAAFIMVNGVPIDDGHSINLISILAQKRIAFRRETRQQMADPSSFLKARARMLVIFVILAFAVVGIAATFALPFGIRLIVVLCILTIAVGASFAVLFRSSE